MLLLSLRCYPLNIMFKAINLALLLLWILVMSSPLLLQYSLVSQFYLNCLLLILLTGYFEISQSCIKF